MKIIYKLTLKEFCTSHIKIFCFIHCMYSQIVWYHGFYDTVYSHAISTNQFCLLTDRDEMSILYREPSIDASYMYQVLVHLAERFQRRRLKCKKLTDDGRQVMAKAHFASGNCSFHPNPLTNMATTGNSCF
jgi:hypothetical protein